MGYGGDYFWSRTIIISPRGNAVNNLVTVFEQAFSEEKLET
jgi:hypothetical protein